MKPAQSNYFKVLKKTILLIVIFLSIYVIIKYLIPFFLPFVVAFILAIINEPFIRFLHKHTKLPRKISSAISLLLTLSIITIIVTLGILKIYNEIIALQGHVGTYVTDFSKVYAEWTKQISSFYDTLPHAITGALNSQLMNITPKIESILEGTATYLINTISSVPTVAVFIVVTILSTYFMSSGRIEIRAFIYKQMPKSWADEFRGIKKETFNSLIGYFRAILLLVSITFVEVLIGLSILRVEYVVLMAVLVGLSDAIPLFGTSIVYVPWIVLNLFTGNVSLAIGLLIIWAIGFIIRQFLEPKIIGKQIGLHPLVTLMSIYVGLSIFGLIGVFVGPISLIIIKNLQNAGLFTLWVE
ncbi:MAG: sporulation integral membrane protein YtvI [Clostridia bacterium]|jgi:sporulation integral membrane protein YtvI